MAKQRAGEMMKEVMECSHCGKPTTQRCTKCQYLLLCSPDCADAMKSKHTADCEVIQRSRGLMNRVGSDLPDPGAGPVPLHVPVEHYIALCGAGEEVRARNKEIEDRLHSGDSTLRTRDKIRYYLELLEAYDSSSSANAQLSMVDKMLLNRKYNALYRDATTRLDSTEIHRLSCEMKQRRIGAFFKN